MKYLKIIKQTYEQWGEKGYCEEAVLLNSKIGMQYFDTASPHFFTGDINAEIVLVHLNPKRASENFGGRNKFSDFNDYLSHHVNFGKLHYGVNSPKKHKSPFDHKQVRFLKPFDALPFKENDKYHNLEIVVDKKLQIELIPFGSPDFNYSFIGQENINPFIERILSLIQLKERKYVIFCGKVFVELLKPYIRKSKTYTFKLTKKNGDKTIHDYNVISIEIEYNEKIIDVVIAPQFAKHGYPVSHYGEMVKRLYKAV